MTLEERIAEAIDLFEWSMGDQHRQAAAFLTSRDYSAAATACHRAYQFQLRATALREVSEDD